MAASLENTEVRNCVLNLIEAFTNGRNIFKRLRDRRRRRKHRKHTEDQSDPISSAELLLSNSLRRGTTDIQVQYETHYYHAGDRFAKGDAVAHASLAETLIRLNSGLVGIIAAFLNHDQKGSLSLDYKSLTNLSDASRVDAINSLNLLYQRLSQSQLHVYRIGACAQCGSMEHQICPGPLTRSKTSSVKSKGLSEKKRQISLKSRSTTHMIARVPLKSSGHSKLTTLAVVRPRTSQNQKRSSSSSSASKSQSTARNSRSSSNTSPLTSPYVSPLTSPLPQYAQLDPFPAQKSSLAKVNAPSTTKQRADSFDGPPLPMIWPHTRPDNTTPLPPTPPPKIPFSKKSSPVYEKSSPVYEKKQPVCEKQQPICEKQQPAFEKQQPLCAGPLFMARRRDKATLSTYTFASESTKIGEIPQRNWNTPWDYEEAERLNAEALMLPSKPATASTESSKSKSKKGIFKFLRRETGKSSGAGSHF